MRRGRRLGVPFLLVLVASMALVIFGPLTVPVAAQTGPPVTGGLVLRLDASDAASITKDGANRVSQWSDLSGHNNHATQGTLANQPLWADNVLAGRPVIRFDGVNRYLTVPDHSTLEPSDISIYMVISPSAWPAATCFLTKRTAFGNGYMLIRATSDEKLWFDWGGSSGGNRWVTSYKPVLDSAVILKLSRGADGRYLYVDGELQDETVHAGSSALVPTASDLYIGRDSYLDQYYFAGDIAEILIYDRALSDAERQGVEQYLGRKWLGWGTACIATATGSGTTCLTTSDGVMSELVAVATPNLPSVAFPHGMFSFKITGLTSGQAVDVTITLPSAVPVGTVWWKYDNGRWHSLPNLSDNGDNIMVIRLTDGGTGDLDNVPGQITDPGGPGNPMTVGWDGSPAGRQGILVLLVALLAVVAAGACVMLVRRLRAEM